MIDVEDEENLQEKKALKPPGQATSGLVFGILGLVLFLLPLIGLLLGLAALASGASARNKIKRAGNTIGKGRANAAFVLGIVDTVIGVLVLMIVIPNYLNMGRRSFDYTTLNNMHNIQLTLEDFADSTKGIYPTSMKDNDTNASKLSDLVPFFHDDELQNPYSHKPCNVLIMNKSTVFPADNEMVDIPPGDIRVYSNGKEYLILGGGNEGKPLTKRLRSN
jgi:hypothetical protein